jgi:hypothetical protein
MQGGLYLDPTSKPRTYDFVMSTRTIEGIYSLDGNTLRLCYNIGTEARRPVGFAAKKGSRQVLFVLKRTYGREAFPFRLADGTRAFPTVIETARREHTPPPPPPRMVPPGANKPNAVTYQGGQNDLAFDRTRALEKKFVVVGRVVTADGKTPLEGVEVMASAGMGTLLRRSGETKTDRYGMFRLVFSSPITFPGGKVAGVAVVHVRKPGWYGFAYGWPARFTLSGEPLDSKAVPAGTTNIVPGRPSPLTFWMQPAASLKVKLLDGGGKPLSNMRLWLTGEDLPPGTNVIESGKTGADGGFAVSDVPRSTYRLVIEDPAGGRGTLELGSIRFHDAAEYTAVATIHEWGRRATRISLEVNRGRKR